MAGTSEEPITSPDQRKPDNPKLIWTLVIAASIVFALLTIGNHKGNVENLWLLALSASGFGYVVIDWTLRRNGLR